MGERSEQERAFLLKRSMHEVLTERERGVTDSESVVIGHGKWWARFKGDRPFLYVMLIVLCMGFVCYLLYDHDQQQKAASGRIESALHESNEIQQAILWVNSLTDKEREKLNLARPKKIMEMQR